MAKAVPKAVASKMAASKASSASSDTTTASKPTGTAATKAPPTKTATGAVKPTSSTVKSSSTPVLDVNKITAPMQALHDSGENFSYEWRETQLRNLQSLLHDHRDELCLALHTDLGKTTVESIATEIIIIENDLRYSLRHLRSWMQRQRVPSPGILFPSRSYLEPRPLAGPAVLIIGPFNYPFLLTLQPLLGALAAGNPVVLKPSELCPTCAAVLAQRIPQYFPKSAVAVVLGGIPETQALVAKQPWGKLFVTGSPATGQALAAAAAKTFTPVTLELGGKTPAYVDESICCSPLSSASIVQQVANRIVWSRFLNCGQTCVAVDTVVITETLLGQFLPAIKQALREQLGEKPEDSPGRIVSQRHAERLVKLLKQVEEAIAAERAIASTTTTTATTIAAASTTPKKKVSKVIVGGSDLCDASDRFIYPTVILNPPADSRLMKEEIFGPILPIVSVKSRTEAVAFMRQLPGTPLALYVFTDSDAVLSEIRQQVPSGTVVRNDAIMQIASQHLPFGGLGTSGYGSYHGKYSFECFSHLQPVVYRLCGLGADLGGLRYPPFTATKEWLVQTVLGSCPDIPIIFTARTTMTMLAFASYAFVQSQPAWRRLLWKAVLQVLEVAVHSVRDIVNSNA